MMKKLISLLLVLSLISTLPLTAFAHDVPEERDDCSIELIVRYDGKDIHGGDLTAIKVGHVESQNGDYWFCREKDHVRIENVESPDTVGELLEFYHENRRTYNFETQTTNVFLGKAEFSELTTGLYLIVQEKAASGYTRLIPFLVTVPYMQDGTYQYDITVTVKSELEREPESTVTEPSKPSKLPQTGQLNWPVPALAAGGMLLLAAGFWLRCGRKKEEYES